ncbi:fibropellin-1-like [Stylophora pistillata]|uniref:fibropellin-1-like n=1 Tax=Stylophora pistillata TaxID=50429 RepID=UPI000C03C1DB|nr:fibropellin-1-like [Stylophora pistillata]
MEIGVLKLSRSYLCVLMIIVTLPDPSKEAKVIDARDKTLSRGTDRGTAYARFKPHKFSHLNITSIGSDFVLKGSECGLACVNIPSCFSFNLGLFHDVIGKVICELLPSDIYNNSEKFVFSQSHHHYSIASPCISWPCQNKRTCAVQYAENSYLCVCVEGFEGKRCELDIDECAEGLHTCDKNAYCNNTAGSYMCACKPAYHGDGENCMLQVI